VELIIHHLPQTSSPSQSPARHRQVYRIFKEQISTTACKRFQRIEKGNSLNDFVCITLIIKLNSYSQTKQIYRSLPIMNINARILPKIVNQVYKNIIKMYLFDPLCDPKCLSQCCKMVYIRESFHVIHHICTFKDI
jgi:hypothetical protein